MRAGGHEMRASVSGRRPCSSHPAAATSASIKATVSCPRRYSLERKDFYTAQPWLGSTSMQAGDEYPFNRRCLFAARMHVRKEPRGRPFAPQSCTISAHWQCSGRGSLRNRKGMYAKVDRTRRHGRPQHPNVPAAHGRLDENAPSSRSLCLLGARRLAILAVH